MSERRFVLIDRNLALPEHIEAYCIHYQACLTEGLMRTHKCVKKPGTGKPCGFFRWLEHEDGEPNEF